MIDVRALKDRWRESPLEPWARVLDAQVAEGLSEARYGDLPRWREALAALPDIDIASTHATGPSGLAPAQLWTAAQHQAVAAGGVDGCRGHLLR